MVDVEKHIRHWRDGASEALDAANDLFEKKHYGFALFLAHLALEKALKALVCRAMGDIPPKIHNLVRLVELAETDISEEDREFLKDMNEYSQTGRYPEFPRPQPDYADTEELLKKTKEVTGWLMNQ